MAPNKSDKIVKKRPKGRPATRGGIRAKDNAPVISGAEVAHPRARGVVIKGDDGSQDAAQGRFRCGVCLDMGYTRSSGNTMHLIGSHYSKFHPFTIDESSYERDSAPVGYRCQNIGDFKSACGANFDCLHVLVGHLRNTHNLIGKLYEIHREASKVEVIARGGVDGLRKLEDENGDESREEGEVDPVPDKPPSTDRDPNGPGGGMGGGMSGGMALPVGA